MVALYASFLMAERDSFPAKIAAALPGEGSSHAARMIADINRNIGNYLTTKTLINSFLGVLSLAQLGSLSTSLVLTALLVTAQLIVGNILEPRLIGRKVNMSPFVVMVALSFWAALWGIPGAILAVPLTSVLLIVLVGLRGQPPHRHPPFERCRGLCCERGMNGPNLQVRGIAQQLGPFGLPFGLSAAVAQLLLPNQRQEGAECLAA